MGPSKSSRHLPDIKVVAGRGQGGGTPIRCCHALRSAASALHLRGGVATRSAAATTNLGAAGRGMRGSVAGDMQCFARGPSACTNGRASARSSIPKCTSERASSNASNPCSAPSDSHSSPSLPASALSQAPSPAPYVPSSARDTASAAFVCFLFSSAYRAFLLSSACFLLRLLFWVGCTYPSFSEKNCTYPSFRKSCTYGNRPKKTVGPPSLRRLGGRGSVAA